MSSRARCARLEPIRLPQPALAFAARAERLRALAVGHAAPEWLLLLASVSDAQRVAVEEIRVPPLRAGNGGPPLAWDALERDETWRRMLNVVLSGTRTTGVPRETLDAVRRLSGLRVASIEDLADRVLAGDVRRDWLACALFVGAALQAWFGALAAAIDPAIVPRPGTGCPVCGSLPVAGVLQAADRARWLACSLCGTEWRLARIRCAVCASDAHVEYFHVEGDPGAQAEACGGCRAYLKLFDEQKRYGAIGSADDAATIALDLLMAEEGYRRAGANLYVAASAQATG